MAWTSADLETVERAIARGESEVRVGDKLVRTRDASELIKVRNMIRAELAQAAAASIAGGWPVTRTVARYSSGLASSGDGDC